jgi:hypothetical protein
MKIKHVPVFNTEEIIKHYTEKDKADISYVCTTDLDASDVPVDIFYRSEPHPEFGNRYFGIFIHPHNGKLMITNADKIENTEFGMIVDDDGQLVYSRSHHDFVRCENGNMIDGGRNYIRSRGIVKIMKVKDGMFEEVIKK